MTLLQKVLWSFNDLQDLKFFRARHASKYSRDSTERNGSSIPLLLSAMVDDKLKTDPPIVEAVGFDSESSGRDLVLGYEKAPWWTYIWVCLVFEPCQDRN
jgi:hypothetical protein